MEQILIVGNVGRDCAIAGSNGSQEAYFSVAVDKSYKKSDGTKVEMTNWYTVWKSPSGVDKFLKKGTKVLVQGRLNMTIDNYQGKQSIKLSIQNPIIQLLSATEKSTEPQESSNVAPQPLPSNSADDKDLPF